MSARSLNKASLIGNLTRDPELRYTPQGTAVCTFGVATNRSWTSSDGQQQEEAEFHRIVAWQKLAELCSQLLFKGRKVFVEGRLQTRKWTGQDGQERQTTEIVIDNMIILDSRRREGERGAVVGGAGSGVVPAKMTDDAAATAITGKPSDDTAKQSGAADKGSKVADDSKAKKREGEVKESKEKSKSALSAKSADSSNKSEEVKAEDIPF